MEQKTYFINERAYTPRQILIRAAHIATDGQRVRVGGTRPCTYIPWDFPAERHKINLESGPLRPGARTNREFVIDVVGDGSIPVITRVS